MARHSSDEERPPRVKKYASRKDKDKKKRKEKASVSDSIIAHWSNETTARSTAARKEALTTKAGKSKTKSNTKSLVSLTSFFILSLTCP